MMKKHNFILCLIFSVLLCKFTKCSNKQCETPFKDEAYSILSKLGFSSTCSSIALKLCDNQCKYDFYQLFSRVKENIAAIDAVFQSTKQDVEAILSCVNTLSPPDESQKSSEIPKYENCQQIKQNGDTESGIKTIYPFKCCPEKQLTVYCEQLRDGGGWTVIQRRAPLAVREQFYRIWLDYVNGFGNLTGEFWLGLEAIHALTAQRTNELRIDLEDLEKVQRYSKYDTFFVAGEDDKYRLSIGGYSGDAGDSMIKWHNGQHFSTFDQDNDNNPKNCAVLYKGAWWYNTCHAANLNGHPYVGVTQSTADGVVWHTFHGHKYSLPKVSMMIRPT